MEVAFKPETHYLMPNKARWHHFRPNRIDWPRNIERPIPMTVPGRIAFLGDSHMKYLFKSYKRQFPRDIENICFFGKGGEYLGVGGEQDNIFLRKYLPLIISWRPSRIFVWVGGNDMGRNNASDTHKAIFLRFMILIDTLRWYMGDNATVALYQPNRDMDRSCLDKEAFKRKSISFNRHFRIMHRSQYYMLPWRCYVFRPEVRNDQAIYLYDGCHLKRDMYDEIARDLHQHYLPH